MPPASTTQVSLVEKIVDTPCKNCNLSHRVKETNVNNNNNEKIIEPDVYDESRPKHDPKFLEPVRNWEKRMGFKTSLRWINIILISAYHCVAVIGFIYHVVQYGFPKWQTTLYGFLVGQVAGFGITAGAHRYWTHRSYKAKMPLQIIVMLCYSVAGQNTIYDWVRDHRVHHKFSETSADPHNARRGFFFSHVGWLMMKKHPHVRREGNKIDMSDIVNDPLVQFHTKYFLWFKLACCFVLPSLVPVFLWNESWYFAIWSQAMIRYLLSLHFTWSVNSLAHMHGPRPYDRFIYPAENWLVSVLALGEGWHNYHHTFPWDYKAAELPYALNLTTLLLDGFAKIGWAYDLKQASPSLVRTIAMNRGERNMSED